MQQKEINFQSLLNISRHMTLDEFHSRYKNVKIIHQTRNSTVRLAIHIQTGQNIIIKSIYKNNIVNSQQKIESILKEVNVLTFLRESKHVTQIYDVIYCLDSFHIVLEYAECGDLFNYINRRNKNLTEAEIKHFFKPIAKTVAMIHRNHIAHRDLKLENVLLDNSGRVMICDFGFATKFNRDRAKTDSSKSNDDNNLCSSICGTVYYEPPEIIRGDKYDPMKADSWSVGVMLYVLMFKTFPFYSPSITDTVQLILSGDVKYPTDMRQTFSDELCDILVSLLIKEPKERVYIDELINSHQQWFTIHSNSSNDDDKSAISSNIDDFDIFNTDALNSLFGINSSASIGNVMKQERIHNSALNTITCSKDDFERLSADEFISYQIIKRRYQLGQMRYMKTRVKSIAPGEFMKIPTPEAVGMNPFSFNDDNGNKSKKANINKDDDTDDDIDTNIISEEKLEIENKDKNKYKNNNLINDNDKNDYSVNFNDNDNDANNENQIYLSELVTKNQDKSKKTAKSQKNNKLPSITPSLESASTIKPRSMSPNGARHIFKVKPRSKKTPSLSPSPISSPSTPRTLPSLLISNSTPLSSQLPPPPLDHESTKERSVALSDGASKDDPDQNKKVFKDSSLNQNSSSLTSITRHTPSLVKQELAKLPDITPIEQLSSLPEIRVDMRNGLGGLNSKSILNTPNSDDDYNRNFQDNKNSELISNSSPKPDLNVVYSRKRNSNRSPMGKRRHESSDTSSSKVKEERIHGANCDVTELFAKVNEFIGKFDEIHIICEEESGVYVKVGNDENEQLFVLIALTAISNKLSSYSINKIRGSDEEMDKFENLFVSNIGV